MKRSFFITTLFLFSGLVACNSQQSETESGAATATEPAVGSYQDIDVEIFKSKMADPDVVILDVRTPEETSEGMIEGAMTLNFRDPGFSEALAALDKEKTYLVYCRSGNRSGKSCKIMAEKGFEKLYNLEGGYTAWSKE